MRRLVLLARYLIDFDSFYCILSEPLTWFDVIQCVWTELFPVLSATMSQCVQEKLASDIEFKLSDFGEDAVNDILERLKGRRTMNNKEIDYLKQLIQRAAEFTRGLPC